VDHRQLSLRRAEVGRVMAFGETTHDLNSSLLHSTADDRAGRVPQKGPIRSSGAELSEHLASVVLKTGLVFPTPVPVDT